jgi:nucleoside-diphosphate-sugar epimerase
MNNTPHRIIEEDCRQVLSGAVEQLAGLRGETLLITGGTGFVGLWITELLVHLNDHHDFGARVKLLSRQDVDARVSVPHLANRNDVEFIRQDVRAIAELPDDVTLLIHAAASPDTRLHASDPLRTIHVITRGTEAVLAAATRLSRLKRMMNVSSALIYGSQSWDVRAMAENYSGGMIDCASMLSSYAEAKRLGETLAAAYRNEHRLPIVTMRPFAFIGPYQRLDRPWAINNFIRDGLQGGPIRILGDGETVRSYMYASDMAFWALRILLAGTTGSTFNVGSPAEIRLKDLAEKIAGYFPVPVPVECRGLVDGRGKRSKMIPDVSAAEMNLGLTVKVDLDSAIRRTLLWNQKTANAAK